MTPKWISPLFWVAAAYDLILGIAFLIAAEPLFTWLNITPPNHWAYAQFGGGVVAVFGIAFVMVALEPMRNRDIITLGVLFKLAYSGVMLGHFFFGSIPVVWTWFAWTDLLFAILFIVARLALKPGPSPAPTST